MELILGRRERRGLIAMSILHGAAKSGDVRAARTALDRGADVNELDRRGRPALVIAAQHGRGPIAELLLDYGADVDAACRGGSEALAQEVGTTALIIAAWTGRSDIVAMLLRRGASVDARAASGVTALGVAKSNGWSDIVQELQEA